MATKLGRVVIYLEELPLIKLLDPLITGFIRSCDMLNILYSTCTRPMAIKHGKMLVHLDGLPPINSHNPLNMCSRECSRDKLKTYLYQQNAYGHKTYQRSDVTQGVSTHKFTYPLNEVVM